MKKAFTLIELVMVIVIIGIIAVVAIPKFVSLRAKAIDAQEDNIAASMQTAVDLRRMEIIAKGGEAGEWGSDSWPVECPLTLLNPGPPYYIYMGVGPTPSDAAPWKWVGTYTPGIWIITCSHRAYGQAVPGHNGRYYRYRFFGSGSEINPKLGEVWLDTSV